MNPKKPSRKKPYEKPSIQSEEILEGAALSCGKCRVGNPTGSSSPSCRSLTKLS